MSILSGYRNSIIAILLLLATFTVTSEAVVIVVSASDYRPQYNFSDDVFKEIPVFPDDFWIKKQLFDTQQIVAEQLTPEYYLQPELYPGWDYFKNDVFNESKLHYTGTYGASVYPSRFTIQNIKVNETTRVSAVLYTAFGVELFQGLQLDILYNHSALKVAQITPQSNLCLLEPTYPYFYQNWSRIIIFEIQLLQTGNHTAEVYEKLPEETADKAWKTTYGDLYISGGSYLGLQVPKMIIYVYGPVADAGSDSINTGRTENNFPFVIILIALIIICCSIATGVYIHGRIKKKQQQ